MSTLPRSNPIGLCVESSLGMIYATLGNRERAEAHGHAYLALAVKSLEQWASAMAQYQWSNTSECSSVNDECMQSRSESAHPLTRSSRDTSRAKGQGRQERGSVRSSVGPSTIG